MNRRNFTQFKKQSNVILVTKNLKWQKQLYLSFEIKICVGIVHVFSWLKIGLQVDADTQI